MNILTDEQRDRAAAELSRLTPDEQHRLLVSVYATMAAHTSDAAVLLQLARDVLGTVHDRGHIPGYREMVTPRPRGGGPALDVEDVLTKLEGTHP